jgi:hypothetical protein
MDVGAPSAIKKPTFPSISMSAPINTTKFTNNISLVNTWPTHTGGSHIKISGRESGKKNELESQKCMCDK